MSSATQSLTPKYILEHWHTQGALWLMEDPLLFEHHEDAFAEAIKKCTNTPEHQSLLKDAAKANPSEIRAAVAGNVNTPIHVLQLFAEGAAYVRQIVASNISTPIALLEQFAGDASDDVRQAAAGNVNTPTRLLQQLAADESWNVREAVAKNINAPISLLEQLTRNEDKSVREAALQSLRNRESSYTTSSQT